MFDKFGEMNSYLSLIHISSEHNLAKDVSAHQEITLFGPLSRHGYRELLLYYS